jgi:hypothetical protein
MQQSFMKINLVRFFFFQNRRDVKFLQTNVKVAYQNEFIIGIFFYMVFSYRTFLASVGVLVQRLNPQPGGPGYLSSSDLSPSSCPAREALTVAMLPPA